MQYHLVQLVISISLQQTKIATRFFLHQVVFKKSLNVIKKLKTKKARRTNDVETVFIKYAKPVISKFLSDMFNVCLSEGTYPDLHKVAEVVPIFKKRRTQQND